jgi:acid stress-induced BolA-like protein IbaG/YrbA
MSASQRSNSLVSRQSCRSVCLTLTGNTILKHKHKMGMRSVALFLVLLLPNNYYSAIMSVQSFTAVVVRRTVAAHHRGGLNILNNNRVVSSHVGSKLFLSSSAETSIVETCRTKISTALNTSNVIVRGAFDDPNGSHIAIEVISSMFEGKRPVQRQQLVYKALWEELQGPVHAVDSMICKTPNEAEKSTK